MTVSLHRSVKKKKHRRNMKEMAACIRVKTVVVRKSLHTVCNAVVMKKHVYTKKHLIFMNKHLTDSSAIIAKISSSRKETWPGIGIHVKGPRLLRRSLPVCTRDVGKRSSTNPKCLSMRSHTAVRNILVNIVTVPSSERIISGNINVGLIWIHYRIGATHLTD